MTLYFQASVASDEESSQSKPNDKSKTEPTQDIMDQFNGIVGMKCRAPCLHGYANAVVSGVEKTDIAQEVPKVTVMFCNPTTLKMLPCKHHLEGKCRFSVNQCRFSHGDAVDVEDLKEFKDPDYR